MDWMAFKLLIVDTTACTLLIIDSANDQLLAEMTYPAGCMPTALAVTTDFNKAVVAANTATNSTMLLIADLQQHCITQLPLDISHVAQFALVPDGSVAYLADLSGKLYSINTATAAIACLGQPETGSCVAIAADHQYIYTAWEHADSGSIAIFEQQGPLVREYPIAGIPTNITINNQYILVPFTASSHTGEGLAVFQPNTPPCNITIGGSPASSLKMYPCSVTVAPDGTTVYVVAEDTGSITVIDLASCQIVRHIPLARSISNLYLLADPRFAIATSNMFGDLLLIDLINGRLLSMTALPNDILNQLAILP